MVDFRRQEDSNVIILKTTACHFMCDLLDEQNYLYFKSKTTVKQLDIKKIHGGWKLALFYRLVCAKIYVSLEI